MSENVLLEYTQKGHGLADWIERLQAIPVTEFTVHDCRQNLGFKQIFRRLDLQDIAVQDHDIGIFANLQRASFRASAKENFG